MYIILLSSPSLFLSMLFLVFLFFFFKQKTAYDMRISDWSSDVCSSDLVQPQNVAYGASYTHSFWQDTSPNSLHPRAAGRTVARQAEDRVCQDRTSVVEGKSVSVRVDIG